MVHILIEKAVVLRFGVRVRVVSNPDIKFVDCASEVTGKYQLLVTDTGPLTRHWRWRMDSDGENGTPSQELQSIARWKWQQ